MGMVLLVIQIITALLLVGSILIQSSKGGLGTAFGGGGEFRTKRGAEQMIFRVTIVLAFVFLAVSIANLLVR
ncbi:preprotein translocase subunit SecG [Candidatus Gottesmanbacteria bacterium RBG_16_52_11]|uniref:Protein-export membrane protein SecG n=1 Tax=Candidatus Gottesmanbacteria bacterium RBG_16_52_11 TaxID=1798374 RepID=A0A1F5YP15_9BACT|nr:MAG: preprotein translocase subunit SecG [Candidatus Gottesmanbacteria bacterium RBG_16_52_11]